MTGGTAADSARWQMLRHLQDDELLDNSNPKVFIEDNSSSNEMQSMGSVK
jgi:hypothetical protein